MSAQFIDALLTALSTSPLALVLGAILYYLVRVFKGIIERVLASHEAAIGRIVEAGTEDNKQFNESLTKLETSVNQNTQVTHTLIGELKAHNAVHAMGESPRMERT